MKKILTGALLFIFSFSYASDYRAASAVSSTGGNITGNLSISSSLTAGNVGISSSTPQGLLVVGSGQGALRVDSTGIASINCGANTLSALRLQSDYSGTGATNGLHFKLDGTDNTGQFILYENAKFQIGTNSNVNITMQGTNVGISSSTPMGLLTVGAGAVPTARFNADDTIDFGSDQVLFRRQVGGTNYLNIGYGNTINVSGSDMYLGVDSGSNINMRTNNIARMVVNDNGVGISSTPWTGGGLLTVGAGSTPAFMVKSDGVASFARYNTYLSTGTQPDIDNYFSVSTGTIYANSLYETGRGVRITAWGNHGANTTSANARLTMNGVELINSGGITVSGSSWRLETIVMRNETTSAACVGSSINGNAVGASKNQYVFCDFTADIEVYVQLYSAGTTGDIDCKGMIIEYIK